MRYLIALMICVFLSSCSDQTPPLRDTQSTSIFVLIENGGTIAPDERESALDVVMHLLEQLTKLERRKASRDTQINIILSSLPNRLAWSGTPRQLMEQAEEIKCLISFKEGFSDLVMAFEQIDTTINLAQPDNVRLYWIGSTINVPFQANDNNTPIEVRVPQEVPENLALVNFLGRLRMLKIMRVHPDQDRMMLEFLGSLGVLAKAKSGEIDFALLGDAQTKARIKNLL